MSVATLGYSEVSGLASLGKDGQDIEGLNKLLAWSIGEAFQANFMQKQTNLF